MSTIYNFVNVIDDYNEAFRGPKSRVDFGKLLFFIYNKNMKL